MTLNIELVDIRKTCRACPSQWDAWDEEGQRYYIRYRFGKLTVDKVPEDIDVSDFGQWENILDISYGGEWDGTMSTNTMLVRTGLTLKTKETSED